MSKAKKQTGPRASARQMMQGIVSLRRMNNRKTTAGRHNQYAGGKLIRHDAA